MSPLKDLVVSGETERRLLAEQKRQQKNTYAMQTVRVADGRCLYQVPLYRISDRLEIGLYVLASTTAEADEIAGLWMDKRDKDGDQWDRGSGSSVRISAWGVRSPQAPEETVSIEQRLAEIP